MERTTFHASAPVYPQPRDWSKWGLVIGLGLTCLQSSGWGRTASAALFVGCAIRQITKQSIGLFLYMGWSSNRLYRSDRIQKPDGRRAKLWNSWHPVDGSSSIEASEMRSVSLELRGGIALDARLLNRGDNLQQEVVVLCSGNAGLYEMSDRALLTECFPGKAIFVYNPPGYGESTGRRSPATDRQSIEAVLEYLTADSGFEPDQIHIVGRSLGSAPACWGASKYPVKSLCLLAPIGKMEDVVARMVKCVVGERLGTCVSWLTTPVVRRFFNYDNVACIRNSQACGLAMLDGGCDIMMTMGGTPEADKLRPAWPLEGKPLAWFTGDCYDHQDCLDVAGASFLLKDLWPQPKS